MEYKMMTFSEEIINLFNDDHYDYLAIHFCLSYVEIQAMLLQLNGYMFNAEEIYLSIESLVRDKFLKKKYGQKKLRMHYSSFMLVYNIMANYPVWFKTSFC